MTRVAVLQSNYLPWRGYFDLISKCDVLVVYDSCQYTVNDWRNRNRLKGPNGPLWITVPVLTKGRTGQLIRGAEVADQRWVRSHQQSMRSALGRAPFWGWLESMLEVAWERALGTVLLHEVNLAMFDAIFHALSLTPTVVDDVDLIAGLDGGLSASARVAEVVARVGGSSYLTGPAGLDYLDAEDFRSRGIVLETIDYSTLRPYPQLFGEWMDQTSVVDLLANVGPGASDWLTSELGPTP